jgi:hypothetical protein
VLLQRVGGEPTCGWTLEQVSIQVESRFARATPDLLGLVVIVQLLAIVGAPIGKGTIDLILLLS